LALKGIMKSLLRSQTGSTLSRPGYQLAHPCNEATPKLSAPLKDGSTLPTTPVHDRLHLFSEVDGIINRLRKFRQSQYPGEQIDALTVQITAS